MVSRKVVLFNRGTFTKVNNANQGLRNDKKERNSFQIISLIV